MWSFSSVCFRFALLRSICVVAVGLCTSVSVFAEVEAQDALPLPFAIGEHLEYQVKLGGVLVGHATLSVSGPEWIGPHRTYRLRMELEGGVPLARVHDRYESWFDPSGRFSRRFHQDQHEVTYKRRRTFDFFPEEKRFVRENGETGSLPTDAPLDDLSFLYFARTLPLHLGESYVLNRYFQADGNPVVLQVLRRETVQVPAGTFRTVVVRPVIRTRGLFSRGGEAEVFFTDDERRIPVWLKSRVPMLGYLTLTLTQAIPR